MLTNMLTTAHVYFVDSLCGLAQGLVVDTPHVAGLYKIMDGPYNELRKTADGPLDDGDMETSQEGLRRKRS